MCEDLITIIIPVFNTGDFLAPCLESIINQTYSNMEIILVNDGSTDMSGDICDYYKSRDKRIKVIHKENGGVSSARNIALNVANGKYIAFVDSDDYVELDYLGELYKAIINNDAEISICAIDRYYNKKYSNMIFTKEEGLIELNTAKYYQGNLVDKLFEKSIIGNTRFQENIYMCEDMLFCNQVFRNCNKIVFINKSLYHYRNNMLSATNQSFNEKVLTSMEAFSRITKLNSENEKIYELCLINEINNSFDIIVQMIYSHKEEQFFEEFNNIVIYLKQKVKKKEFCKIAIKKRIQIFFLKINCKVFIKIKRLMKK